MYKPIIIFGLVGNKKKKGVDMGKSE